MTLPRRQLGRSPLHVPRVVFGAYALGGGYWGAVDDDLGERAIEAALEVGMDAFDTAPVYGFGHSESLLGRVLERVGSDALVLTKVGIRFEDVTGPGDRSMPGVDGTPRPVELDSRPESVRREVERSCERLRRERLDLVQVHARDPRTPVADTMGALADLVREGRVRAVGVSNYSVAELEQARDALGSVPLASDQPQYSLIERGIEQDVLPWAREHDVGLVVYTPLAQGLLTGKVRAGHRFTGHDGRARNPRFTGEFPERVNAALDAAVAPIAARHDATLAQVVLAWTVAEPGVTAALVGARSPEQVRQNAVGGRLELTDDERATIRAAFEPLQWRPPKPSLLRRIVGRLRG